MENILISVDFGEDNSQLLEKGYELARAFGAKIWLIHIAAPDPDFVGYDVGPQYIRDSRATQLRKEHKMLTEYANTLNEKGIESDGLLIQGATTEAIVEESKKLNIDLIIAGYHDHSFFYNAFVGHTSSGLIKRSKIPVMIVPLD